MYHPTVIERGCQTQSYGWDAAWGASLQATLPLTLLNLTLYVNPNPDSNPHPQKYFLRLSPLEAIAWQVPGPCDGLQR